MRDRLLDRRAPGPDTASDLDPTPLQRALKAAPDRVVAEVARPEREFFCFRLGELRLGVPSENVREVIRASVLTPLPRVPPYILGVSGHRGEVLPVIDLLRFLGKGEARIGPRTRLFVGLSGALTCGVVADSVVGLRRVPTASILPAPMGADVSSEHLMGVVQMPDRTVLNLLNFTKVLQAARQRAVSR